MPVTQDVPADAPSILGITVAASGTSRDTLGLLISPVTPGGPADRGGIDPGSRLAEVNNVSLRIAAADIGRRESEEGALRLLAREL
jgi:S1-C subfamily serine protease